MSKKPPAERSQKWDTILRALVGDHQFVAPVRAEWDTGEYAGRCYALRNFRLGRYEWAYGPIPADRLCDYEPQEEVDHGRRES